MDDRVKADLERQGYRVVGSHSAIKPCFYCKSGLKGTDLCYKNTFYGIKSWRCLQMSVAVQFCNNKCTFCWRDTNYFTPTWHGPVDEPNFIIDKALEEHRKYLQGFKGNPNVDKKLFEEAMSPLHVALSLTGESVMYPRMPELIEAFHKRGMTTYLVTNGLSPDMLQKLLEHQPTQLYITLGAPDEESYIKTCRPAVKNPWQKIQESLALLPKFKRSVIKLTLVKGMNMVSPEKYAELIRKASPTFIEVKAGMVVGHAQYRLEIEAMPTYAEMKAFAENISQRSGYKIIDSKLNSRVLLLMKEDTKDRLLFARDSFIETQVDEVLVAKEAEAEGLFHPSQITM